MHAKEDVEKKKKKKSCFIQFSLMHEPENFCSTACIDYERCANDDMINCALKIEDGYVLSARYMEAFRYSTFKPLPHPYCQMLCVKIVFLLQYVKLSSMN